MTHIATSRTLASRLWAAALCCGALLGLAPAAQARTDVQLSIGVPAPPVDVHPHPVHSPPAVVYQRPWPSAYRHLHPRAYEREQARRHAEWQRREWERRHHGWDRMGPPDRHGRH